MGANQSHNDTDDSESSESSESSDSYDSADDSYDSDCTTTEETSYLENYPDPLGRFKSIFVIKNISKIMENMDIKPTHHSKWFHKMNISFSHGISLVNPRTTLCFYVACKVKNTIGEFWKVKANVIIKIRSFIMERGTITHNCGELCFSRRDSDMLALHGRTNLHLVNLFGEYVRNNEMIVEADIRVVEVEGFYQPLVINYRLSPLDPENWFRFNFPDETFHCNKAILNAHVKTGSNFNISKMTPFRSSCGILEEFLDCVYGFPIPILRRVGIRKFLKFSNAFNISAVVRRVETTVIQRSKIDHFCRKIAVRFNLRRFMHTWLNRKKSIKKKDVEDLDIEMMSGEIMKAIVKRVFEVGWKMDEEN